MIRKSGKAPVPSSSVARPFAVRNSLSSWKISCSNHFFLFLCSAIFVRSFVALSSFLIRERSCFLLLIVSFGSERSLLDRKIGKSNASFLGPVRVSRARVRLRTLRHVVKRRAQMLRCFFVCNHLSGIGVKFRGTSDDGCTSPLGLSWEIFAERLVDGQSGPNEGSRATRHTRGIKLR